MSAASASHEVPALKCKKPPSDGAEPASRNDQLGGEVGSTNSASESPPQDFCIRAGIVGCDGLNWHRGDTAFALHLGDSRVPLLSVVPDAVFPNMWRVSLWGRLSDLANLPRTLDAGMTLALAELNQHRQETAKEAPPVRQISRRYQ